MLKIKSNKWIKPGLYTSFNRFSVVLLGLVNFLILARVLSKAEFGVWILFTSLVSILEILREGFIKQPFIAFLSSMQNEQGKQIESAALYLNLVYSLLISILLFLVAMPLEMFWAAPKLGLLLKIYCISNLIFIPLSHFEYLQQVKLEFKGIFYSHLMRSVIPTVFIVFSFFLTFDLTLPFLAIAILIGNLVGAGLCIFFGWSFRYGILKPDRIIVTSLLRFGRYSLGTNLASVSIRNMDTWLLGKMLTTESVALYNPAIRISNLVEIPTLTIANLVFPKMAEEFRNNDHSKSGKLYKQSVALLLAIMIPISLLMFIFSDFIVLLVAGKAYLDAAYLLKITAFYTLLIPFGRQFGIFLDAVRKPEINFIFILGTSILSLVITFFFIRQWGLAGAAFGTLTTYLIRFAVQQILLRKMFGIFTIEIFSATWGFYLQGLRLIKSITFEYKGRSK